MQQNRAHPHPRPIPVQPVHHCVSLPLSTQFLPSLLNSTRCTRRRNRTFPTGIPSVSPRPTALYPLCAFPNLAPAQTGPQEGWVVQWGLLSCLLTSFFPLEIKIHLVVEASLRCFCGQPIHGCRIVPVPVWHWSTAGESLLTSPHPSSPSVSLRTRSQGVGILRWQMLLLLHRQNELVQGKDPVRGDALAPGHH